MDELIAEYENEMYPLNKGNATCPVCGDVLDEEDCYDHEYNGNSMERLVVGVCPSCKNHYQWREVFFFHGHSNVEQTDGEYDYEPDIDECGFDPYMGCYTDDC